VAPVTTTTAPLTGTSLAGSHPLNLQWVEFEPGGEVPGEIIFTELGDELYTVDGSQENSVGDYVTVEGTMRMVSEEDLAFDGIIETKVSHINGGAPCLRTGEMVFRAIGGRSYWRLQSLTNPCENSALVDYVDIFR